MGTASGHDPASKAYAICVGVGLAMATGLLFGPVYYGFVVWESGDFTAVSRYAERLARGGPIVSPHFLFPLAVAKLKLLLPNLSYPQLTWLVLMACQVGTALLVFRLLAAAGQFTAGWTGYLVCAAITLALLVAGPINFWSIPDQNLHAGYFNLNNFHNPTSNALKPAAVWLFFLLVSRHKNRAPVGARLVLAAATVHTLSLLIKPSFSLYFVPAFSAWFLLQVARGRALDWRLPVLAIGLPFLVIALVQFSVTYTEVAARPREISLAPLAVISKSTPMAAIPLKLLCSILFPLWVALGDPRRQGGAVGMEPGLDWFCGGGGFRLFSGGKRHGRQQFSGW